MAAISEPKVKFSVSHPECIALDLSKTNKTFRGKESGYSGKVNVQHGCENDQFYFSNMLRNMVLSGNNRSTEVWKPLTPSNGGQSLLPGKFHAWSGVGNWSGNGNVTTPSMSVFHYAQSWLRHVGNCQGHSKTIKRTRHHEKQRKVSQTDVVLRKRKSDLRLNRSANHFRLHQSSAFSSPHSVSRNQQRNSPGKAVNVRYVMSNLGRIYAPFRNDAKPEEEKANGGQQTTDGGDANASNVALRDDNAEQTDRPPCKRFSALIGLEIVVDYVKRNDE